MSERERERERQENQTEEREKRKCERDFGGLNVIKVEFFGEFRGPKWNFD